MFAGPAVFEKRDGETILVGVASYVDPGYLIRKPIKMCGPYANKGKGHWGRHKSSFVDVFQYANRIEKAIKLEKKVKRFPGNCFGIHLNF